MKKIFSMLALSVAVSCNIVNASPLVTADVPLDSKFYTYLEKVENIMQK